MICLSFTDTHSHAHSHSFTHTFTHTFTRTQCKRLTLANPKLCREKGHHVERIKTKKRFFTCSSCKHHTYTLGQRLPVGPCKKCGKTTWKVSSMLREKKDSGAKQLVTHFGDHPSLHRS